MDSGATKLYNTLMGNPGYNAIGRTTGAMANTGDNRNFFQKKWDSIENSLGSTGAALYITGGDLISPIKSRITGEEYYSHKDEQQNQKMDDLLSGGKQKLEDIAKKYGYQSLDDYYNVLEDAEANDQEKYNQLLSTVQEELKAQSKATADAVKKSADEYNDFVENNYASKKINQDRGKFAGSAINTMSTALDLTGLTANPLANTIQGGIEGVADELEQNGLENFSWDRAGQNAAIGAATGLASGLVNTGMNSMLTKNGGNLFKGGNKLTRGLNRLGSSTPVGRGVSTVLTGAGRGAVSGAVGGGVGGGLSAAMNGGDVGQAALQGAVQGAKQGAVTGGVMAGANMAISRTPGVGKFYNDLQSAKTRWDQSGSNFDERLTNTINSGDSAIGNWLNRKTTSNLLASAGNLGNSVRDISESSERVTTRTLGDELENSGAAYAPKETVKQFLQQNRKFVVDNPDYYDNPKSIIDDYDSMLDRLNDINEDYIYIENNQMTESDLHIQPSSFVKDKFKNIDPDLQPKTLGQTETPTTAKGWLKRAGERIIEDANDRGVGLGIKDVSQDMPEDVRNLKINDWNDTPETEALAEEVIVPNKTRTQAVQGDAWDRLAQQNGYNSYDDVIEAYLEANPNVKLNQNGAAGQILSWLDENPNTPTTAGEWVKRAGQRIVEDANERGVGLGIKDVSQETPETEIYRALMPEEVGTEETLPEVFEPEARNQIEKRNKFQSLGEQLETAANQQKYRALYDSLDGKTATRAVETNAPETLSKMGIKPENYLEAAKTSNYVNQVVSDLADESNVRVDIPDMPNRLLAAADDVAFDGVDAPAKFKRAVQQVIADGTTPDEYSAGYLLEKSRDFGNKAASVKGTSNDSQALRTAYTNAKYILRDEAANALANANITGDETNANIAQGLSKMGANQKVIDYYTEPIDGEAPTAKDYIRRSSLFEQARDMGTQVKAEQLTRSASKQPTNWATRIWRASGLDQPVELVLSNTIAPAAAAVTKATGKGLKGIGNVVAKFSNDTPTTTTNVDTTPTVVDTNYNPATNIYNAIGRTEGLINGENARTADYLVGAAKEAEIVPDTATSLEGLVSPNTNANASNSIYNTIYGTRTNSIPTFASQEEEREVYFFPPTGDEWTDMLSRAMRRAKNAEDYSALSSLYNMYEDAVSKAQKTTTSSEQKLTATQQRANAAMNSLNRLSSMTPDFAYDLSSIPVIGDIATFGGNDYEAEAKSLAQQIGYMVSGSNIKESEAEAIGKSYVPQPWDNEQVRKNKLRRAYEIITQYQNGYSEA